MSADVCGTGSRMTCERCAGCLVRESIYRQGAWWWRCYNCGARTDGAILLNRAEQAAADADRLVAMERDCQEWAAWMRKIPLAPLVSIP